MALLISAKMNFYPSSQNHSDPQCPEGVVIDGGDVLEHPDLSAPVRL